MTTKRITRIKKAGLIFLALALLVGSIAIDPKPAKAASYQMKTGQYLGIGASAKSISGLGFTPNLVMIKSSGALATYFKTSAMPANTSSTLGATAVDTSTAITLDADGFTVAASNIALNNSNTTHYWMAFGGSDCTSTGNFCVGTYTGNNSNPRAIPTGFQPKVAVVKRSTAVAANFRTATMPANRGEYFLSTAAVTTGALFASLDATSFTVGSTNNANGGIYYYFAFGGSTVAEGSYTGNGTDNTSITAPGFLPGAVFVKNSGSATVNNRRAVMSFNSHYGDHTSYVADALVVTTNFIQAMQSSGFQIGSGVGVNENTFTHYWFAMGAESAPATGSGTFSMAQGTYTGTGSGFSVTGLGFAPDLVIIKGDNTTDASYRTRHYLGDLTYRMVTSVAAYAGGITTMDNDGFTLGTSTNINTTGNTYHWQAFGNAFDPDTQTGAADFAIGTFYGNGIDNRNITQLPFSPSLLVGRSVGGLAPWFRTSTQAGDISSSFGPTADSGNVFQSFDPNGFQVGTGSVNTNNTVTFWFAFKSSDYFTNGTYSGNSSDDRVVPVTSFRPDLLWIKRSTAIGGIFRPSTVSGDATMSFGATANTTGKIKAFNGGGFTIGITTEVNFSAGTYRYMAWRGPLPGTLSIGVVDSGGTPVASPSFAFEAVNQNFDCGSSYAYLGTSSQRIRVSNQRISASWTTSIAATDGPTAKWSNVGATNFYDYNETVDAGNSYGCYDAASFDTDSYGGYLELDPDTMTISPEASCDNTSISKGSVASFKEGVVNAITIASATLGANTECYWDMTGITAWQVIPVEQPTGEYSINMTVTTVAS